MIDDISYYDVPKEFRSDPDLNIYKCPKCLKLGRWRAGYEFEHMMRCSKCEIVWTPHEVEFFQRLLRG